MLPLDIVSLTCNVITIVDFGIKTVAACNELRKNGSTKELSDTSANAVQLKLSFDRLKASTPATAGPKDVSLVCLARDCAATAQALLNELDKLNITKSQGALKTLIKALEISWKKGDIEKLQRKLEQHRRALDTRILTGLSERLDVQALAQTTAFRKLDIQLQGMIKAIGNGSKSVTDVVTAQYAESQRITREEHEITRRHVTDAGTTVVSNVKHSEQALAGMISTATASGITQTQQTEAHLNHAISTANAVMIDQTRRLVISEARRTEILNSLWSPSTMNRQEVVADRRLYAGTFDWIFEEPGVVRSWSNFGEWLKQDTITEESIFWVNGKAGSGKSTLMNFIFHDPRTRDYLQVWAGAQRLVMPVFFFWRGLSRDRVDVSYQNSIPGMLRSVIHQMLIAEPTLMQDFLEVLNLSPGEQFEDMPFRMPLWTTERLFTVLRHLASQSNVPLRLCFFIDGLDELSEGYMEVLAIVKSIAELKASKVCASSRPEHDIHDAFKSAPQLRLQDLTRDDMYTLVTNRLEEAKGLRKIITQGGRESLVELCDDVVDRADGVFLWAIFAVKQLQDGARYKDTFEQLQSRLSELPEDLEDLYTVMFNSISEVHKEQAFRFFRWMCTASQDQPLSVLDFALMDDPEIGRIVLNPANRGRLVDLLREHFVELTEQCEDMQIYLVTRCAGLLVLHDELESQTLGHCSSSEDGSETGSGPESAEKLMKDSQFLLPLHQMVGKFHRCKVNFLHRSVVGFLESTIFDVKVKDITFHGLNTRDLHISRCLAFLGVLRLSGYLLPFSEALYDTAEWRAHSTIQRTPIEILQWLSMVEDLNVQTRPSPIEIIADVFDELLSTLDTFHAEHDSWQSFELSSSKRFISFSTIFRRCIDYVLSQDHNQSEKDNLLCCALARRLGAFTHADCEIVYRLLILGANPNALAAIHTSTPQQTIWHNLLGVGLRSPIWNPSYYLIVKMFLSHGADISQACWQRWSTSSRDTGLPIWIRATPLFLFLLPRRDDEGDYRSFIDAMFAKDASNFCERLVVNDRLIASEMVGPFFDIIRAHEAKLWAGIFERHGPDPELMKIAKSYGTFLEENWNPWVDNITEQITSSRSSCPY